MQPLSSVARTPSPCCVGRRGRRSRGLSLVEVLISLFILFVASVYLLELFMGGFHTFDRSLELTTATALAQQKMEQVLVYDVVSGQAASGNFVAPYKDYTYDVSTRAWSTDLTQVQVDVRSRHGTVAHLVTLKAGALDFAGMATDSDSSTTFFRKQATLGGDGFLQSTTAFTALSALPAGGELAGVALDSHDSVAWVADRVNKCLWLYDFTKSVWNGPYRPLTGLGTPSGIATDATASVVYVADVTNKKLWLYRASDNSWRALPAASPPLGKPCGLACDGFASTLVVADYTNGCVRFYNDENGTWSAVQAGMGTLQRPTGVCMSHTGGGAAFVVDASALWKIDLELPSLPLSQVYSLPSSMTSRSGLATDLYSSTFWFNDFLDGRIWYYNGSGLTPYTVP